MADVGRYARPLRWNRQQARTTGAHVYWLRACGWDDDELNGPHASVVDAALIAQSLSLADDMADIDRIWECEWVDGVGNSASVHDFDLLT
jgi:hypothetical protein